MCGISAIAGHKPVARELLESLLKLEYRGYDSCGMALFDDNRLVVRKNVGAINEVNEIEHFAEMKGNIGVAHTRWATHGAVTRQNSHPHLSGDGKFAVVHNGIFGNYIEVKAELIAKGYEFVSETDTEVFSNLLQYEHAKDSDLEEAFCRALKRVEGSYAIAMITTYQPGAVFAAKKDSPLIIGLADGSNYISSDINAFVSNTREAVLPDDYEYVVMTNDNVRIRRLNNKRLISNPKRLEVDWDAEAAQIGGFSHYMLKEIFDQPQTVKSALRIPGEEIKAIAREFADKKQSFLVGVGTTYYVSMIGSYLFSQYAGMYVPAVSADEFPYLVPVNRDCHALFFSQSGETFDTRMAIRAAKKKDAAVSAVVNMIGSSISQEADNCVFQGAGPEICVVSTKAALSQIVIVWRVCLETALLKNRISLEEANKIHEYLLEFPNIIEKLLNEESGFIKNLASSAAHVKNWLFMGKGVYYPVALESALKMKEVTYLHAEGLPAGFLKHGTLAMVDELIYSLFFLPHKKEKDIYQSTLTAVEEVKARGGKVIGFCMESDEKAQELLDDFLLLPDAYPELFPFIQLVMAQLFSYYSALRLGLNIDKPRNLAKSVTVG